VTDPTPVEDAEPIPHEDDDAIIAGVVRQAGAEVAKRWTTGHPGTPGHSPFEDTRVLVAAIVAVVCLTLASAVSTVSMYRSIQSQHRVADAVTELEARCPTP
jgi:hypothetical protein